MISAFRLHLRVSRSCSSPASIPLRARQNVVLNRDGRRQTSKDKRRRILDDRNIDGATRIASVVRVFTDFVPSKVRTFVIKSLRNEPRKLIDIGLLGFGINSP